MRVEVMVGEGKGKGKVEAAAEAAGVRPWVLVVDDGKAERDGSQGGDEGHGCSSRADGRWGEVWLPVVTGCFCRRKKNEKGSGCVLRQLAGEESETVAEAW